jgi:hypothetical protein
MCLTFKCWRRVCYSFIVGVLIQLWPLRVRNTFWILECFPSFYSWSSTLWLPEKCTWKLFSTYTSPLSSPTSVCVKHLCLIKSTKPLYSRCNTFSLKARFQVVYMRAWKPFLTESMVGNIPTSVSSNIVPILANLTRWLSIHQDDHFHSKFP